MARLLRIEFPGGLYHVTSWDDRREAIYEDDADRSRFLLVVREAYRHTATACGVANRSANASLLAAMFHPIADSMIFPGRGRRMGAE